MRQFENRQERSRQCRFFFVTFWVGCHLLQVWWRFEFIAEEWWYVWSTHQLPPRWQWLYCKNRRTSYVTWMQVQLGSLPERHGGPVPFLSLMSMWTFPRSTFWLCTFYQVGLANEHLCIFQMKSCSTNSFLDDTMQCSPEKVLTKKRMACPSLWPIKTYCQGTFYNLSSDWLLHVLQEQNFCL